MKRTGILLLLFMLPLCLVSMNPLSDSDLSEVTGQSGVTIHIDAALDVSFAQVGWGDTDGVSGISTQGGWIGIDGLKMEHLHVWPRTDFAMDSSDFGGSYVQNGDGGPSDIQFVTLDLVQVPADATDQAGMRTVLRTGIPTLSIAMDSMLVNIVLGPFKDNPAINGYKPNFNQLLGQLYLSGLNVATGRDGVALISSHDNGSPIDSMISNMLFGAGISMELQNVKVDYLLIDKLAWGDIDGIADVYTTDRAHASQGLNGEGWIGLRDLAIKNLVIDGQTFIDVGATLASDCSTIGNIHALGKDAYLDLPGTMNEIYNVIFDDDGGKKIASITLGDGFAVTMEKLAAQIVLGKSTSDDDFVERMGDIHMAGMRLDISDNPETHARSYVRIFAH